MNGVIDIDIEKLLLAALLLTVNIAVSWRFRLALERKVGIAAIRMTVQLICVGLILEAVFSRSDPWLAALTFCIMMGFAAREVYARQARPIRGLVGWLAGGLGLWIAAISLTVFALVVVIGHDPWWEMRFAVPLFGIILGNAMTGVALAIDGFTRAVAREQAAVEAMLALGQPFHRAVAPILREAIATGMTPILNSMSATGLVFLPGMMVGQILAGAPPMIAIKYQLMLMFLLASGIAISILLSLSIVTRLLTDPRHRLRLDRLASPAA